MVLSIVGWPRMGRTHFILYWGAILLAKSTVDWLYGFSLVQSVQRQYYDGADTSLKCLLKTRRERESRNDEDIDEAPIIFLCLSSRMGYLLHKHNVIKILL